MEPSPISSLKSLFITGIDFYRNSYASHHPDYGNIDLKTVKTIFKKGDGNDVHDINKQFKYFKSYLIVLFVLSIQIILGIFTLLSGLNLYLASLHQITSVILVFSALNLNHKLS